MSSRAQRAVLVAVLLASSAGQAVAPPERARVELPAAASAGPMSVEQALRQRRSTRSFAAQALTLADLGQVLWAAQGITSARGQRTAPSAGALYPLELLLVAVRIDDLAPGLYRYDAPAHALVLLRGGDWRADLSAATPGQAWIGQAPAIVVLTAVPARTAPRYGDRALRYVQIEAGHAAQNVYLQATARGLSTTFVGAFDDATLGARLGLSEGQIPLGLMPVGRAR